MPSLLKYSEEDGFQIAITYYMASEIQHWYSLALHVNHFPPEAAKVFPNQSVQ